MNGERREKGEKSETASHPVDLQLFSGERTDVRKVGIIVSHRGIEVFEPNIPGFKSKSL